MFAKSVEKVLLRAPIKCNEIDAAGRVSGIQVEAKFCFLRV